MYDEVTNSLWEAASWDMVGNGNESMHDDVWGACALRLKVKFSQRSLIVTLSVLGQRDFGHGCHVSYCSKRKFYLWRNRDAWRRSSSVMVSYGSHVDFSLDVG